MANKYSIDEADLAAAAPAIEELWTRNLAGHKGDSARTKLQRAYVNNPAGPGTVVLLRVEGTSNPQGAQGLHPRSFHLGSRPLLAIGLADYVVNADHRTLGPALMLLRRAVQLGTERFDLIYGMPNAKAVPVFTRAGLKCLGAVRRYAKPLGTRHRLAQYVPIGVAASVAPVVDGALRLRDRARSSCGAQLSCEAAAWDDEVFDDVWIRRPPGLLLAERSGRLLRWRFATPAAAGWRACAARNDQGVVQGYIVWRDIAGFAQIGDFFTIDPGSLTTSLMLAFARYATYAGVQTISVEFFGSSVVADQLRRAGMVMRRDHAPVFALGNPNAALALESSDVWYLTEFDNDGD
jgi:hypothetical protein